MFSFVERPTRADVAKGEERRMELERRNAANRETGVLAPSLGEAKNVARSQLKDSFALSQKSLSFSIELTHRKTAMGRGNDGSNRQRNFRIKNNLELHEIDRTNLRNQVFERSKNVTKLVGKKSFENVKSNRLSMREKGPTLTFF